MALFRIQIEALSVLAFWSIVVVLAQSVDGGRLFRVGGDTGWNFTRTSDGSSVDYQAWASSVQISVGDALDFGVSLKQNDVMLVSSDEEKTCNATDGKLLSPTESNTVLFNITSPGQFSFVSPVPDYCTSGMKFTVTVSAIDEQSFSSPSPQDSELHVGENAPSTCSHCGSHILLYSNLFGWTVGLGTGAVLSIVVMTIITRRRRSLLLRRSQKDDTQSDTHSPSSSGSGDLEAGRRERLQSFSYEQIKGATKNFNSSLVLGEGGFGRVYKAYIGGSPGYPVAVKRMSKDASQGAREFMAEVNIFSQLRHPNLVQLLGWCDENEEFILVYEYMPNGDLDDRIFGGYLGDQDPQFSPLSWTCRYNIFCGVAKALVYLHEELAQRILHRDVKTSNVMLDSEFNARLGDFGLARLSMHGQDPRTTEVAGTKGYLAPEFILSGRISEKTDVYAFGIVVLEVTCARRPSVPNSVSLLDLVWNLHKEEKLLDAIDPKLDIRNRSNSDEDDMMKRALRVGLLCCHPHPPSRPTMRQVLNILTEESPLPEMPDSYPKPSFSDDM
ncbi:unnamed protein product [Calypogeia fissa]